MTITLMQPPSFEGVRLETPRLVLRFLEPSDAPSLLEIFSDPEVMRYWSTAPWTSLDDARERIARDQEAMAAGTYICLGCVRIAGEGVGASGRVGGERYVAHCAIALRAIIVRSTL